MRNSFSTLSSTNFNDELFSYYSLKKLCDSFDLTPLPSAQKLLLENLLRHKMVLTPPKRTLN
ncbi:MAG: aconitase A [Candidatus Azotimanducaceae bacterium]|jgi:aconitase A